MLSNENELFGLGYTRAEIQKILNDEANVKRDAELEAEE
jgi:hypothetical protein